jgi:hypothetical protein
MRPLILALLALAVAAPAASADPILPVYDASDGVRVVNKAGAPVRIRFDAKADRLYRTIAGRKVVKVCTGVSPQGTELVVDSTISSSGGRALPRRRGTVTTSAAGVDMCAIGTRPSKDESCLLLRAEQDWCARVIVAVNADGRAYLDQRSWTLELFNADDQLRGLPPEWAPTPVELLRGVVEPEVVGLDSPDASPPAGKLGLAGDADNHTIVALRADGVRRFLRREGDVVSTNDPGLLGRPLTVF